MFSHIMVGANDIEKSKEFYDKVLGTMGCEPGALSVNPTGHKRYMYWKSWLSLKSKEMSIIFQIYDVDLETKTHLL